MKLPTVNDFYTHSVMANGAVLRINRWPLSLFTLSTVAIALIAPPSLADPSGFQGSYVGVTLDSQNAEASLEALMQSGSGLTWAMDQAANADGEKPAGDRQFQGRLDIPQVPLSVRTTVVVGEEVRAVLPTLSYDLAIAEGANVYAGAGYAIVREGETPTALGDRNGVVLTTGAEASIGSSLVVYGDVRFRPDRSRTEDPSQVRLQVGVGRRF